MQCTVLLFAQLAEALDTRQLTIELPDDSTVGEALDLLASRHEAIESLRDHIAVAVDEAYAGIQTTLSPDCTIALIPPVSGG